MEIPEANKRVSVSWAVIAAIVFGTFSLTTTYWNVVRQGHRIDAKTERNSEKIDHEIKLLEERLKMYVDMKFEKEKKND